MIELNNQYKQTKSKKDTVCVIYKIPGLLQKRKQLQIKYSLTSLEKNRTTRRIKDFTQHA